MSGKPSLAVEPADPRLPAIRGLIAELDRMMEELYPAESIFLLDPEALIGPDAVFLAGLVDGEPLACGAVVFRGQDYGEVKRLYVSPRARGLGLAKRILIRLEDEARKRGLALLRLETGRRQPEALELFASLGFLPRPAFGDYPADDPFSLFMEKRL
jgi:putative acetyltransferase